MNSISHTTSTAIVRPVLSAVARRFASGHGHAAPSGPVVPVASLKLPEDYVYGITKQKVLYAVGGFLAYSVGTDLIQRARAAARGETTIASEKPQEQSHGHH
ncbi:hypothetical protein PROFUN_06300 [Planoprotostelium fungivorum]|uniref:Uncharacterized protein n=1 Tax=Planoprotostelium fungivorum TaxID=1890364 RepID=A0A2P6NE96_9EUKA|nr:hypothetical protein PROFUN_06300 [Planoprotostelium fungivorum]